MGEKEWVKTLLKVLMKKDSWVKTLYKSMGEKIVGEKFVKGMVKTL